MATTTEAIVHNHHHHHHNHVNINNNNDNNNSDRHQPSRSSRRHIQQQQQNPPLLPPPHQRTRLQQSLSSSPSRSTSVKARESGTGITTTTSEVHLAPSRLSASVRSHPSRRIRLTLLCAKNLTKGRIFFNFSNFSLPDVFCKIEAGSQNWTTETVTGTTSPVFRWTHDMHLSKSDAVIISVWNRKKTEKGQKGFLGCVRIKPSDIVRLRDTGFQRLDLHKLKDEDNDTVKGEVIVSILSRERTGGSTDGHSSHSSRSSSTRPSSHPSGHSSSAFSTGRSRDGPTHSEPKSAPQSNTVTSIKAAVTGVAVAVTTSTITTVSTVTTSSSSRDNNVSGSTSSSSGRPNSLPSVASHPVPPNSSSSTNNVSQTTTPTNPSTTSTTTTASKIIKKPPMPLPDDVSSTKLQSTTTTTTTATVSNASTKSNTTLSSPASCVIPNHVQNRKVLISKITSFRQVLSSLQPSSGHCRLEVSRRDIFEESYQGVMKMKTKQLRKKLMVKFRGEEGIDYGGVAREWIYLLSKEMLNPDYGLFAYTREDLYTLHVNPRSHVNPDHLSYFHFVGRVIGLALFHGHYIGGCFSHTFYRLLLNKPITLDDIRVVDPELHRGLQWMLDNPLDDAFEGTTFSVDDDHFGQMHILDLKPGGRDVPITEENKHEYVRLFVNYRFKRGIESQFLTLLKGFHEVVPPELLLDFDERELEVMIAGFGQIDLNDWKSNTRLKHCTLDSKIVKWFWIAIESYSEEQRAQLLQFVTGSPRVPLQGFKALQGTTGATDPRLFTINLVEGSSTDNLPQAHTCFNRIDIPPYESYDRLLEKLTQAIEETDAFGLD